MPLCFKYHIVEFSSKIFFHQLQVNRERTHISNILQLIVTYGSLYIYLLHSSLQKHLERLQDKRKIKICGIYMKKTQETAYVCATCSKTSKMGKTQLTAAQQLGAQWTCSQKNKHLYLTLNSKQISPSLLAQEPLKEAAPAHPPPVLVS